MLICPVCKTKAKKENQEYCLNCAWELEYYFSELSDDEQKRYKKKLRIAQKSYSNRTLKKRTFLGRFLTSIVLILIGIFAVFVISIVITKLILGVDDSHNISYEENRTMSYDQYLETNDTMIYDINGS